MLYVQFWIATAERAVKTFAQSLVALLGAGAVDVLATDWSQKMSVALGAAMISVLTSIASSGFGGAAGPSLVGAEALMTGDLEEVDA